jgi:hypothetical protein
VRFPEDWPSAPAASRSGRTRLLRTYRRKVFPLRKLKLKS